MRFENTDFSCGEIFAKPIAHPVVAGLWRLVPKLIPAVVHRHCEQPPWTRGATLPGCSGERLVPRFMPEAWRIATIDAQELPELVTMAESHLDVVCAMFA